MAFFAAMDAKQPTHTLGENASLELTAEGVGEPRVALFAALAAMLGQIHVFHLALDFGCCLGHGSVAVFLFYGSRDP